MATGRAIPADLAISVRVPASTANLGAGFDCVGLALGLWDSYEMVTTASPGVRVEVSGSVDGLHDLPTDCNHLVARTLLECWSDVAVPAPPGLLIRANCAIPQGRGLGSSASAIVAGVAAAQAFQRLADGTASVRGGKVALDLDAICEAASLREGHGDNASASTLGGATLSWDAAAMALFPELNQRRRIRSVQLDVHPSLRVQVLVPSAVLLTTVARAALPTGVGMDVATRAVGRAALLTWALTKDPALLWQATADELHQEPRRSSYPEAMALVDRLRADGVAACISGAGPSVLLLSESSGGQGHRVQVPPGWTSHTLQVPSSGVSVERATFDVLHGERM